MSRNWDKEINPPPQREGTKMAKGDWVLVDSLGGWALNAELTKNGRLSLKKAEYIRSFGSPYDGCLDFPKIFGSRKSQDDVRRAA